MGHRTGNVVGAALIALLTLGLVGVPSARARDRPSACGGEVRRVSTRTRGTPVLFVHGFAGAPSDFRRRLDGRPSMLDVVGRIPGAVTFTFDYSDHSLGWVTEPAIGRRLAEVVACLASEHDRPVTVVAHSMGGLATRQAQGEVVEGRPVADSIARVVTVGTPFRGAQLLGFGGGIAGEIASELINGALRACSIDFARRPGRSFCGLLDATETAAVQGMIPGSDQLRALPRWAERLRIVPMAAAIDVGFDGPFGFSESFSAGDLAVSVHSATADASPGVRPFVAKCRASLFGIVDAIDDSPCSHANEVANRRIVRHVRDAVARGVKPVS